MAQYKDSDFITLYPGVYTEGEKELFKAYLDECEAINKRGTIDVSAMISGKLPEDTPGYEKIFPVPEELVKYQNARIDPENRLINDKEYAKSMGYKNIFALPTFTPHSNVDKAFPPAARDTILANQLNGNITSYLPIYPGDTLYLVVNKRTIRDITPEEGSTHRFLAISGEASIYNQDGEKVNDMVWNICEGIRIFKEECRPMKREDMGFGDSWEGPDWLKRPQHHYTDQDWEFIIDIWKNEKLQGAQPLYWEDVKIGDEPAPTLDGPIMEGPVPDESSGHGKGGSVTLKKLMLETDYKQTMDRDPKTGLYTPKKRSDYIPEFPNLSGDSKSDERGENFSEVEIHLKDESSGVRGVLMNYVGRDIAVRHINNWIGDHGWLKTIRWEIMTKELMELYDKKVPLSPFIGNYMKQVPYMRDKFLDAHPLTEDIALVKSYVTDKYIENGEHLVELVWWIETIDHYIYCDGQAVVKLPSKNEGGCQ
ncbi:MAG: MaoC family dehydratase N-terminal domain-containing protein [Clostridiales bacterium]|nr:MaoC family dehydratase N-terminal domain-containing protein [Clostridiales bacterium]